MRGPGFFLALWLSKAIARGIDLVAKGRGTNLPGVVALKIDPNFLSHFRGIDPEKTIFITGTNGKSTTTNLLNRVLTQAGYKVISNLDGANMTPGVAVPLLKSGSLTGRVNCDFLVMETDERYVARIRKQIPAKYLGITNIQKDQVQRNGEPSFIYNKILESIHPDMTIFVSGDEPNTLSLTKASPEHTVSYGVASHAHSFQKEDDFFAVSMPCPKCHSGLQFKEYNLDNVGLFHCPVCGFQTIQEPDYQARDISFEDETFRIGQHIYPFHCNTSEFLYSYILACSVALTLGVEASAIAGALDKFKGLSSRRSDHKLGDHTLKFYKIKQENSETLQSTANTISLDKSKKALIFGLDEYIDFYPPYINGCYMFDCSLRALQRSNVEQCICTSPALGHCGALRLMYDGFPQDSISILPDSTGKTLSQALQNISTDNIYLIEELPFFRR